MGCQCAKMPKGAAGDQPHDPRYNSPLQKQLSVRNPAAAPTGGRGASAAATTPRASKAAEVARARAEVRRREAIEEAEHAVALAAARLQQTRARKEATQDALHAQEREAQKTRARRFASITHKKAMRRDEAAIGELLARVTCLLYTSPSPRD